MKNDECNYIPIKLKPLLEAATGGALQENVFLETSQKLQQNTCPRDSFLTKLQAEGCKKETMVQVFSCEFCET